MKIKSLIGIASLIFIVAACQKTIQLKLPKYEPKLVLEFYLQDGYPLACLLQESINYTDTAKVKLVQGALVILSYNGLSDTLFNTPYVDKELGKISNYFNPKKIKLLPNTDYYVYINDGKGKEIRGKTSVKDIVPIKTLTYKYDDANKASAAVVFNDDGNTTNYYMFAAFRNTPSFGEGLVRDTRLNDIIFNGRQFSFDTRFVYEKGDTVTARLYHLTDEHYNFVESVSNAQAANGNPFGQPANILSNVTGGIGVFSTLNYDQKVEIIK